MSGLTRRWCPEGVARTLLCATEFRHAPILGIVGSRSDLAVLIGERVPGPPLLVAAYGVWRGGRAILGLVHYVVLPIVLPLSDTHML